MSDFNDKTPPDPQNLDEVRMELRRQRWQLSQGAQTFGTMRKILLTVALMAVGGMGSALYLAVSTGRFIEQTEDTRESQREAAHEIGVVRGEVRALDTKQQLMAKDIDEVKATTTRIEKKLDGPKTDPLGRRRRR